MKKTLTLTESELIKVINKIVESYSETQHDEEDYFEVFLQNFRPWVRKNHGDEVGEYPMSFLIKKYLEEFVTDSGMRPEEVIFSYRNNITNAVNIGRTLVRSGRAKLKSLRPQEKFTVKYKRAIDYFIEQMNLPDYIEVIFVEDNPYEVRCYLKVDWVRAIKSEGDKKYRVNTIMTDIQNRIRDFLGVEFGKSIHGDLSFKEGRLEYVGLEEWTKKVLNKEIKKKIKELPNSRILHAIKFEATGGTIGGFLKFSFKGYSGQTEFIRSAMSLLQDMGYNTKILTVER